MEDAVEMTKISEGTVLRIYGLGALGADPVDVVVGKVEPAKGGEGVVIYPR